MTFTIDPNLIENNEVQITEDGNGDLAIKHVPSGQTLTIDDSVSISDVLANGEDFDGQGQSSLTNVQSLDADSASISGQTTTGSLDTDEAQFGKRWGPDFGVDYPHSPVSGGPAQYPQWERLERANPIIDGSIDASITGAADPYLVYEDETDLFHLFFEAFPSDDTDEDIGQATSRDLENWTYEGLCLTGSGLNASPHVIRQNGEWYMTPNRAAGGDTIVYKHDGELLNQSWSAVATPTTTEGFDPHIVFWRGKYYLFVKSSGTNEQKLYYSDTIEQDNWTEHPDSPILSPSDGTRIVGDIVPLQHNLLSYWTEPVANEVLGDGFKLTQKIITTLTESRYEAQTPSQPDVLLPTEDGGEFDSRTVHHLSVIANATLERPVAVFDGKDISDNEYALGLATATDEFTVNSKIYLNTTTSIPDGTTDLPFDNIGRDVGHVADLANDGVVVPSRGTYRIYAQTRLQSISGSPTRFAISIKSQSDNRIATANVQASTDTVVYPSVQTTELLDAGELVTVGLFNNSGSAVDAVGKEKDTFLTIERV